MLKFGYSTPEEIPVDVSMVDPLASSNLFFGEQKEDEFREVLDERLKETSKVSEASLTKQAETNLSIERLAQEIEQKGAGDIKYLARAQRRFEARVQAGKSLGLTEGEVSFIFYGGLSKVSSPLDIELEEEDPQQFLFEEPKEPEEELELDTTEYTGGYGTKGPMPGAVKDFRGRVIGLPSHLSALKDWQDVEGRLVSLSSRMKSNRALPTKNVTEGISSKTVKISSLVDALRESSFATSQAHLKTLAILTHKVSVVLDDLHKKLDLLTPVSGGQLNTSQLILAASEKSNFLPFVIRRQEDLLDVLSEGLRSLANVKTDLTRVASRQDTSGTLDQDLDGYNSKHADNTQYNVQTNMGGQTEPGLEQTGLQMNDRVQDKSGNVGQVSEVTSDGQIRVKYDAGDMNEGLYTGDSLQKGEITRVASNEDLLSFEE